jgi:tetratricopeptide (TPR) repeat protein
LGITYDKLGQHKKSLDLFNKALEQCKENNSEKMLILLNRAITLNNLEEVEKALLDCNFILKFEKNNPLVFIARSYSNCQLTNYEEALRDINRSI